MSRQQPRPSGGTLLSIPWRLIRPMPGQPREHFDQAKLDQLARSIRRVGQRSPVQVVSLDNDRTHQYELIDGQRRWHAVQLAGIDDLRCEVFDVADVETRYVMSVVANLCREGHEPLEMAAAFRRMQRTMTLDEIAEATARSVPSIGQYLSLLKLAPPVQAAMSPALPRNERLVFSAAIMLAGLSHEDQVAALGKMRSLKTSPLRAARAIVGATPRRPGQRKRVPADDWRVIRARIDRVRVDLTALASDTFAGLLRTRQPEEVAAIRETLNQIATEVARLANASAI